VITVTVDSSALTKKLNNVKKRQIPYAMMLALNNTAFDVRAAEQAQMGRDFDQVSRFTKAGVQVRKATRSSLKSEVFIEQKRQRYIDIQVRGGTRTPARKALIIPSTVMRNQKDLRPRLLARKGAFEATTRKGLSGIWQVRGKKQALKLLAVYKGKAVYQPRLRFYETGEAEARRAFPIRFAASLARALATAR